MVDNHDHKIVQNIANVIETTTGNTSKRSKFENHSFFKTFVFSCVRHLALKKIALTLALVGIGVEDSGDA